MSRGLQHLLSLLILCCCTWSMAAAAEPSTSATVRIGVTASKTGELSEVSNLMLRGMRMWIEDVNERGALLGQQVELVVRDDASSPTTAAQAYRALLAEGVKLFVSPYSSSMTLSVQEALGKADYAMVSVASAPEIWRGNDPRIFGIYTPADQNMRPLLAVAAEQSLKTLAIAHLDSDFPNAVAKGLQSMAAEFGLAIVSSERYQPGEDLQPLVNKLKQLNPDVVAVGSYLDDAIAFSQAAAASGLQPKLIGFSGGPALRDYGEALGLPSADGVLSSVQWMRSVHFPGAFDFGFRYRQQHSIYPSYDAAGGYAALQVLEAAVRLADSTEPSAVRGQLKDMKFRSILGHYRADDSGKQVAKSTYLVQWQDGHISLVYPKVLARWDLRFPFPGW